MVKRKIEELSGYYSVRNSITIFSYENREPLLGKEERVFPSSSLFLEFHAVVKRLFDDGTFRFF